MRALCPPSGTRGLYGQVCQVRTEPGGDGGRDHPAGNHGQVGHVFTATTGMYSRPNCIFAAKRTTGISFCRIGAGGPGHRRADPAQVQGVRLVELERGAVLRRLPDPEAEAHTGWAKVGLVDGCSGYVRDVALEPVRFSMTAVFTQEGGRTFDEALAKAEGCKPEELVPRAIDRWFGGSEEAFRNALAEQAKKYLGTEYRWGGKSGRGIDCSGLVSSAYMQCGVLIYRDAKLVEGWPMHQIPLEQAKRGDALYFPGPSRLYLGEGALHPLHRCRPPAAGGAQQP